MGEKSYRRRNTNDEETHLNSMLWFRLSLMLTITSRGCMVLSLHFAEVTLPRNSSAAPRCRQANGLRYAHEPARVQDVVVSKTCINVCINDATVKDKVERGRTRAV